MRRVYLTPARAACLSVAAALVTCGFVGAADSAPTAAATEAVGSAAAAAPPTLAVGDVGPNQALLWVQGNRPARVIVELGPDAGGPLQRIQRELDPAADFTAKIPVEGLSPGRRQRWRALFLDADEAVATTLQGSFLTAPPSTAPMPVRLAWGGDLAGQDVCRDAARGFEVFSAIAAREPALFVGLGDMIYADGLCTAEGRYGNAQVPGDFDRAANLDDFRAHWRYARADAGLRQLLANAVYLPTWDDHEVVNDFGPLHDTRDTAPYSAGEHLLPIGLAAMLEQNPITEHPDRPGRLYRAIRWGKHLELLLLDTRQYRDANTAPDSAERPKTLLGREQLTWLKHRLARSDATWVVVASSVPLAIPTGWPAEGGRDGWAAGDQATGFAQELRGILASAADAGRTDLLFISADVHFAAAFSYRPEPERGGFVVHELVTGPLSAGLGAIDSYDRDLGAERLFMHAPPSRDAVHSYADARRFFGFGELDVAESGTLTATLRDVDGSALYTLVLTPAAATRLAQHLP
jgi:alkaline phosphatase D